MVPLVRRRRLGTFGDQLIDQRGRVLRRSGLVALTLDDVAVLFWDVIIHGVDVDDEPRYPQRVDGAIVDRWQGSANFLAICHGFEARGGTMETRGRKRPSLKMKPNHQLEAKHFLESCGFFIGPARGLLGEMTLASLHVFITVAVRPGISVKAIAQATDLSQAGASRALDSLGFRKRNGGPGLGLVAAYARYDLDGRKHCYTLSDDGQRIAVDLFNAYLKRQISRRWWGVEGAPKDKVLE
jgi:DNA-binding MarR family transcriptional regulator